MKLVVSLLLSCIERYCFSKRYDSRSPLIIAIPTKLLFTSYPRSFNFCNLLPQADNLFFHRYCFNKIILENFFEQVEGKCYKLPLWLSPFLLFFSLLFYFLFIAWETLSHHGQGHMIVWESSTQTKQHLYKQTDQSNGNS